MTTDLEMLDDMSGVLDDPLMKTPESIAAGIATATKTPPPLIQESEGVVVKLPAGYIDPASGSLFNTAIVRGLVGYDEEKLSRVDVNKNSAVWTTELLALAVESIGSLKPTREMVSSLLIGDRDALFLGISKATYGPDLKFTLTCDACDTISDVTVNIDEDIPVNTLDDPFKREFDVPLTKGVVTVRLINGTVQESFSELIGKRTSAEITSVMLAKSIVRVNGQDVYSGGGEELARAMSAVDRATLTDFIATHQPGPDFTKGVEVPCATCGKLHQIPLGMDNFFRF